MGEASRPAIFTRLWGAETPESITVKFGMSGNVQYAYANFGENRLRGFRVVRARILPFSIHLRRSPYKTLALPYKDQTILASLNVRTLTLHVSGICITITTMLVTRSIINQSVSGLSNESHYKVH